MSCIICEYPLRKVENTERVSILEFMVMVEAKSPKFWNEGEISGYDD